MNLKRRAVFTALWLATVSALPGPELLAAQSTEGEPPPSVAVIDGRLREVTQDPSLDDAIRASIRGLYQQALSEIEAAARQRGAALDFGRRTTEAPGALGELEAALSAPPADLPPISGLDNLDALEQRRAEVGRQLEEAASRLTEADAEPLRRTSRRAEIRETLAELAAEAAEIEAELEVSPAPDANPLESDARRTLLSARRLHVENRTVSLQRELGAYDAERPLLPHRRDWAARDVASLQEEMNRLDATTDALRRLDASQQANEARVQAIQLGLTVGDESEGTRRVLLAVAGTNNELTARRQELVNQLDTAERRLDESRAVLADLNDRFTRTRERVAAIGQTGAVGLLLQRQRVGLPDDIRRYREERRAVEQRARLVQEEMFDLDEQRLALADIEGRAAALFAAADEAGEEPLDELGQRPDRGPGEEVIASVRSMLETQRTYLGLLFDDQARYFDVLVQVGTTYGELHGTGEAFLRFIDERVLWTRNAEPIGLSDLEPAWAAASWLLHPARWAALTRTLANDVAQGPWRFVPVFAFLIAMPVLWPRFRAALTACGQRAAAGTATRYSPTAHGLLLTVGIAVPGPAVAWLLARRVAAASDESEFVQVVGAGLAAVAVTSFPLELLRQLGRPQGLMAAHFRWSSRAVAVLRRHLRWFTAAALPCVFVLAATVSQEDQAWHHALGRLALVALQIASAVFLTRVLHPARGVFGEFLGAHAALGWNGCATSGSALRSAYRWAWPAWRWPATCTPPTNSAPSRWKRCGWPRRSSSCTAWCPAGC